MPLDPCLTLCGIYLRSHAPSQEGCPALLVPSSCLPGGKLYFNTSPKTICLPPLLPSLPPQPQGDEGLTLSDMDIKPLSYIYAAWGHMLKPQRQVASLSKLSYCFSHLVAEAAFPPHIKCSVPFSP